MKVERAKFEAAYREFGQLEKSLKRSGLSETELKKLLPQALLLKGYTAMMMGSGRSVKVGVRP